jgi:hypothetical protein
VKASSDKAERDANWVETIGRFSRLAFAMKG